MWQSIVTFLSSFNMQLILLVCTGVLAITLLVLALTRWGQSSPVWKCIVLSFAAHILMIVFAYGTILIEQVPGIAESPNERINLHLIAGDEITRDDPNLDREIPDWTKSVVSNLMPKVVDDLERPEMDSEVVFDRTEPVQNDAATDTESNQANEQLEQPLPQTLLPSLSESSPSLLDRESETSVKLDSPPMEDQRLKTQELAEPPKFSAPLELAKLDPKNDFQPIPDRQNEFGKQSPGMDEDFVDPNSRIQKFEPGALPVPQLADSDNAPPQLPPLPGDTSAFRKANFLKRVSDASPMPEIYSLRRSTSREKIAINNGGSVETENAVDLGLKWLAESQENDGSWDASRWGAGSEKQVFGHDRKGAGAEADTGITGLAALALLAGGNSHLEGPYRENVRRALDYLVAKQKSNGDLAGNAELFARMYCHSMALLALSEALAVTGDQRLLFSVQRGADYSIGSQNRQDGGWRYQPGDAGDMSQHGWHVLSLHSAKMGGATIPDESFDRMRNFVNRCAIGRHKGLSSYRPGQGPSTTMTAEALVCRFMLNETMTPEMINEAVRKISLERPTPLDINLYYWYYGTLAMYQVGGPEWEAWNQELKRTLVKTQVGSGSNTGSWEPDCLWGGYGGRVYSTAMATLSLQVYYRYLPGSRMARGDVEALYR